MNNKTKGCFVVSVAFICIILIPIIVYVRIMDNVYFERFLSVYNEIPLGISMDECRVILEKTFVSKYYLKLQDRENCIRIYDVLPFDRWELFFYFDENKLVCIRMTEMDDSTLSEKLPPPKSIGDCPHCCNLPEI